jgi:F0F1-type ATP synthase alpha subunit
VVAVTFGKIRFNGMGAAQYVEMIEFNGDTLGRALNLEQ